MDKRPLRSIGLYSQFHDAGEVDLYHLCGGDWILERLAGYLVIHGKESDTRKIQEELETTLSGQNRRLVTWSLLDSSSSAKKGFQNLYIEARERRMIYKAAFTLDNQALKPVTARIFTPHFLFSCFQESSSHLLSLLEFFRHRFSDDIISEKHCPLIVMFIYHNETPTEYPLPRLHCGNDTTKFLKEIGLPQYANLMFHKGYGNMNRVLYQMHQQEREVMFKQCCFQSRDRAQFSSTSFEYARQLGRPIVEFY